MKKMALKMTLIPHKMKVVSTIKVQKMVKPTIKRLEGRVKLNLMTQRMMAAAVSITLITI